MLTFLFARGQGDFLAAMNTDTLSVFRAWVTEVPRWRLTYEGRGNLRLFASWGVCPGPIRPANRLPPSLHARAARGRPAYICTGETPPPRRLAALHSAKSFSALSKTRESRLLPFLRPSRDLFRVRPRPLLICTRVPLPLNPRHLPAVDRTVGLACLRGDETLSVRPQRTCS